ncbi:MAG: YcfL family protein [Planctomycetota bacterium]|nr:YcfL family protein [Planctomycetota bacterium]MEC8559856.1 YcfL family protein [Planctomycetota bacterium]MEC9156571.1 YcfL family protein [Planctomycetota bacterium]MED5506319.1 YcfL family protein [Planctomycetota bacterium]
MTRILLSALLVPAMLLSACGSVNTYRATAGDEPGKTRYQEQINDALTSIFLKAEAVRFARTPGGPYQVQVTVANDDFRYRRFAYQFEWLDANGMQVPSGSTWQTATIASGGTVVISSVAPNDTCETFQLQTRRSN